MLMGDMVDPRQSIVPHTQGRQTGHGSGSQTSPTPSSSLSSWLGLYSAGQLSQTSPAPSPVRLNRRVQRANCMPDKIAIKSITILRGGTFREQKERRTQAEKSGMSPASFLSQESAKSRKGGCEPLRIPGQAGPDLRNDAIGNLGPHVAARG